MGSLAHCEDLATVVDGWQVSNQRMLMRFHLSCSCSDLLGAFGLAKKLTWYDKTMCVYNMDSSSLVNIVKCKVYEAVLLEYLIPCSSFYVTDENKR